jgi:hypothetical protein
MALPLLWRFGRLARSGRAARNRKARESNEANTDAVTTIVAPARSSEPASDLREGARRAGRRDVRRRIAAHVIGIGDGDDGLVVVVTTITPVTTSDVVRARVRSVPSALDNLYKRGGPGVRVSPRYGR